MTYRMKFDLQRTISSVHRHNVPYAI